MSPAGSEIRGENAQFGRPSAGLVGGGGRMGLPILGGGWEHWVEMYLDVPAKSNDLELIVIQAG